MNHICFFVILVTISLYLSIGRCSTIDKRIISAPDSCLSHAECPASDFCQTNTLSNTSFTCVSRFKKDDVCNSDIDYECESTLFCSSPSAGNNGRSRCRPRSVLGQPCLLSSFQSCAGLPSVVCSPNTKTCVEAEERNLDEDCTSTSCNQTEGLFCDGFTCNRKSTVGGYCEPYSDYCDDTSHCANPFTPSYNINYNTYMCLKSAVAGQKCSSDEQCNGDELICNKPKASEGKCIDASQRIAKLGQPCNPALDKCDSRRGLSCRYLQKGHHVCMHRVVFRTEINYATVPYCSPMNKYSRCTPRFGRPTECRLLSSCEDYPRCEEAALDQTYSIYEEDRHYIRPTAVFPSCHEKQRLLGQGSLCNMYENEICGHGLRCDFVPNIQETANDVPVIDGKSVKKTAHCVKVVSIVNGNCSNPFRHKCDAGLQCVHGLCKRSTKAISKIERQPKSHLGIYSRDRCDTSPLPCAPGLDCTKEGLCDRPIRMVSNGRPCFDTSTHKRVSERILFVFF